MTATTLGTPLADDSVRSINFFNGRLLTGGDLSREQAARRLADRRVGATVGPGVAWGLEVTVEDAAAGQVKVTRGLGVGAAGVVLYLATDPVVHLVAPAREATASVVAGFGPCAAATSGGSLVAGDGLYLMTLAPVTVAEGKAPVLALDSVNTRCSTDAYAEAVQFRLLPISGFEPAGTDAPALARFRNEIAYAAFAQPATAMAHSAAGQEVETRVADTLGPSGLTDCDVPLAVVYMDDGAIVFVDRWCVRRRIAADSANPSWAAWIGERRVAAAEAQLAQFQDQIDATPALLAAAASAALRWLPAAGFLPPGTDWKVFLAALAPTREVPLAAADVPGVLGRALADDPIALGSGTRMRVFRIGDSAGPLLFTRDRRNGELAEQVWLDGERAGFGISIRDVQAAIDRLRAGSCLHQVFWPGMDLVKAFRELRPSANLTLCFEAGSYEITDTLVLSKLGRVRVHGHGARLTNLNGECALLIESCAAAEVDDMAFGGNKAGSGKDRFGIGLYGALTILDTPQIRVEKVQARCASASKLAAAALVVGYSARVVDVWAGPEVSVSDCELSVGSGQLGLLLLNAGVADLMRNRVSAAPGGKSLLRGIVVAGKRAGCVRVDGNVVRNVVQGIAVGVSESGEKQQDLLQAERVLVANNRIELQLADATREAGRFGVFVGNAASALVAGNHVKVIDGDVRALELHAIRLAGSYGAQLIVRDNLVEGSYAGIVFQPKDIRPALWAFQCNVGVGLATKLLQVPDAAKGAIVDEHNATLS